MREGTLLSVSLAPGPLIITFCQHIQQRLSFFTGSVVYRQFPYFSVIHEPWLKKKRTLGFPGHAPVALIAYFPTLDKRASSPAIPIFPDDNPWTTLPKR